MISHDTERQFYWPLSLNIVCFEDQDLSLFNELLATDHFI